MNGIAFLTNNVIILKYLLEKIIMGSDCLIYKMELTKKDGGIREAPNLTCYVLPAVQGKRRRFREF